MPRLDVIFWVPVSVVLLDQGTKYLISGLLNLCTRAACESIVLLPFFQLMLLHNEGAAFSFLSDAGGWQRWFLIGVSILVGLYLIFWLYRLHPSQRLLSLALALILGGAAGNLVDRLLLGHVVDFLVFHYDRWYFPAFNFADASISMGVLLMLLNMLLAPFGSTPSSQRSGSS